MQNTLIRATRITGPRKLVRQLPLRCGWLFQFSYARWINLAQSTPIAAISPLAFSLIPLNLLMSTAFSRMRLTYLIDIYTKISI